MFISVKKYKQWCADKDFCFPRYSIEKMTMLSLQKLLSNKIEITDNDLNMAYITLKKREQLLEDYIDELGEGYISSYDDLIPTEI
ncbi:hypothetical protein [Apibacter adventoris]|uniref:hypothetical protein n=1 Tax=Apibacter adventoris TaxID=1679466 RepID=UPI0011B00B71|nr:hypothetical protein [Apibacter adventoris]